MRKREERVWVSGFREKGMNREVDRYRIIVDVTPKQSKEERSEWFWWWRGSASVVALLACCLQI